MTSRAFKRPCGHSSCKDWHVYPQASVQGVSFTQQEAELVASTLNKFNKENDDG